MRTIQLQIHWPNFVETLGKTHSVKELVSNMIIYAKRGPCEVRARGGWLTFINHGAFGKVGLERTTVLTSGLRPGNQGLGGTLLLLLREGKVRTNIAPPGEPPEHVWLRFHLDGKITISKIRKPWDGTTLVRVRGTYDELQDAMAGVIATPFPIIVNGDEWELSKMYRLHWRQRGRIDLCYRTPECQGFVRRGPGHSVKDVGGDLLVPNDWYWSVGRGSLNEAGKVWLRAVVNRWKENNTPRVHTMFSSEESRVRSEGFPLRNLHPAKKTMSDIRDACTAAIGILGFSRENVPWGLVGDTASPKWSALDKFWEGWEPLADSMRVAGYYFRRSTMKPYELLSECIKMTYRQVMDAEHYGRMSCLPRVGKTYAGILAPGSPRGSSDRWGREAGAFEEYKRIIPERYRVMGAVSQFARHYSEPCGTRITYRPQPLPQGLRNLAGYFPLIPEKIKDLDVVMTSGVAVATRPGDPPPDINERDLRLYVTWRVIMAHVASVLSGSLPGLAISTRDIDCLAYQVGSLLVLQTRHPTWRKPLETNIIIRLCQTACEEMAHYIAGDAIGHGSRFHRAFSSLMHHLDYSSAISAVRGLAYLSRSELSSVLVKGIECVAKTR